MSFRTDIPNYASLASDVYEMQHMPIRLFSSLEGLVVRTANIEEEEVSNRLYAILSLFASLVPCSMPRGEGWGQLIREDLPDVLAEIRRKGDIAVLMTCLEVLMEYGLPYESVNQLLIAHNIGYEYCDDDRGTGWIARQSNIDVIVELEETQASVESISEQAKEQIKSALDGLVDADNERSRKNIVWNLVCAMESLVKKLANDRDIENATRKLREAEIWGKDVLVKDGLSIFNRMHDLYPDLRHGSEQESTMGIEEAYYWVSRISCYMRYMARMSNRNNV